MVINRMYILSHPSLPQGNERETNKRASGYCLVVAAMRSEAVCMVNINLGMSSRLIQLYLKLKAIRDESTVEVYQFSWQIYETYSF